MTNGKLSKAVIQYDLDGNFIKEWVSLKEIERQLNYKTGNISACCRGYQIRENGKIKKRVSSYGFKWKYKEEQN